MSDLEKTEKPSDRKLEKARDEGQTTQSRDLNTFMILAASSIALLAMADWIGARMQHFMASGLSIERAVLADEKLMFARIVALLKDGFEVLVPLFIVTITAAVAGPLLIGGFRVTPKAMAFKGSRMNPLQGLKRMFASQGLIEMLKSILKSALVAGVATWVFMLNIDLFFSLMRTSPNEGIARLSNNLIWQTAFVTFGLMILAAIDVPLQKWQFLKKMRMSKQEVRDEHKEIEGDPHVKARIRQMQRERSRQRMMESVPGASVVVTNPTHYAVALKYDPARAAAPYVVAKGRGEIALKIRAIALENKVPMLEAPPLARALYKHCEIDVSIPVTLYKTVAEVMAYIFQLNRWAKEGGPRPAPPAALPVPEGMDPHEKIISNATANKNSNTGSGEKN